LREHFFSQHTIEERASHLLRRYAQWSGCHIDLPVPVDKIAEGYLDLHLLWEPINPVGPREVIAKLQPFERQVVFNETHLPLFESTVGLERTTLAHEVGHWELHFDQSLLSQFALPGLNQSHSYSVYRDGTKDRRERQAHSYMGYLLMPHSLLMPVLKQFDLLSWSSLYQLRDFLEVTITALNIRLQNLGVLYVGPDGKLYESREVYDGQMKL
jgi:hypothetical protein